VIDQVSTGSKPKRSTIEGETYLNAKQNKKRRTEMSRQGQGKKEIGTDESNG
jgi:hypothetical protein